MVIRFRVRTKADGDEGRQNRCLGQVRIGNSGGVQKGGAGGVNQANWVWTGSPSGGKAKEELRAICIQNLNRQGRLGHTGRQSATGRSDHHRSF